VAYKHVLRAPVEGEYLFTVSKMYETNLTEIVALLRFQIDTGRKADIVERVGVEWKCTAYVYPIDFPIGEPIDPTLRKVPSYGSPTPKNGRSGGASEDAETFEEVEERDD
jgi:hypothetical protein